MNWRHYLLPYRRRMLYAALLWAIGILWAMGGWASCWAAERPNIVVIFTDDQGWHDVGCYGSEIPTPHIDSLARQGMKLTQFYAASSICTPSRYGLLTGRFPTRSEDHLLSALMFLSEEDSTRGIRTGEVTYVQRLAEVGYQTALVGKWHLGHGSPHFWPTEHGFQSFFGHTGGCVDFFSLHYGTQPDWYRDRELVAPGRYATDAITEEALRVLEQSTQNAAPLYLHIAYNAPHFGKAGNPETGEVTNIMQPKPEDLKRVPASISESTRRDFAAKVIGMDEGIGRILAKLDTLHLSDDTLVIFMTDHGGDPSYGGSNDPLRGGKATLFEGGLRVPCLVRWPGQIPANSVASAVTCAVDLAPTCYELAGLAAENWPTDGQSMLPIWMGAEEPQERTLIWQTGNHQELQRKSWTALRQGRWKMVDPPEQAAMLFDLENDPQEQVDLATSQPARLDELQTLAQRILERHQSP